MFLAFLLSVTKWQSFSFINKNVSLKYDKFLRSLGPLYSREEEDYVPKLSLSNGLFFELSLKKLEPIWKYTPKIGNNMIGTLNEGYTYSVSRLKDETLGKEWSNTFLFSKEIWQSMNEANIDTTKDGLKVEVSTDRNWGLAYFSNLYLSSNISGVKIHITYVHPKGRWVMKLRGDLLGDGRDLTFQLFSSSKAGVESVNLDPRFSLHWMPPLEIQLGLEGEPGAYAIFKSVEFIEGKPAPRAKSPAGQRSFEAIELMPDLPKPFKILDWPSLARSYVDFIFDTKRGNEYLPLVWMDDTDEKALAFGLPSYVGTSQKGSEHEAVTTISSLLTASLMGIEKKELLPMVKTYYSKDVGLVLNRKGMKNTSGDWWYDIWPSMLFLMLCSKHPELDDKGQIIKSIGERWYEACLQLRGNKNLPDFAHTAFDFQSMKPVDRGWAEPDSSAGIAWLEYIAWLRFRREKYLQAVDWCLRYLESLKQNPYYEVLLPWGAYIAARANAELGRDYDIYKLLSWCFSLSDYRWGWGVLLGKWGGYDCYGLVGSATDLGGYAFAMNTFAQAGALAPIPRYDSRYAYAIGKWLLNLTNSARLFFPHELPSDKQSSYFWMKKVGGRVPIAYEALRQNWEGKTPFATGDALRLGWAKTDLGLYGSGHIGLLASLIRSTNVKGIIMWDCLATDFFHSPAYPTYLIYNPYGERKEIEIYIGNEKSDIYEVVSHRFIKKAVKGKTRIYLVPRSSAVLVFTPAEGKMQRIGKRLLINGIFVDYGF